MELFKASSQWASRPDDERFSTLAELHAACKAYADASTIMEVPYSSLRVEAQDKELVITRGATPAKFSHWAFGQLCSRIAAPASYLRQLPATLAAHNVNHGLKERGEEAGEAQLMFHKNGSLLLRALTSPKYARIWNYEIAERLMGLKDGWRVPPARPARADQPGTRLATAEDVLSVRNSSGLSISIGDPIAPAGLYASDHDMFCFLVNEDVRIAEPGNPDGLSRGIFVENSEVGASSLRFTRFLYRSVCGNHIVWGASKVVELSIRHIGDASRKARMMEVEFRKYAEESSSDETAKIETARKFLLGATKEEVLDLIFKKSILSRRAAEAAYTLADSNPVDGDPRSAWGLAQGVTRLSQDSKFADERTDLDRAGGKVIELAF